MSLSPADQARLQQLLQQRDQLRSGQSVRSVQEGNRRVEYGQASLTSIEREIESLQLQGSRRSQRGALRFTV